MVETFIEVSLNQQEDFLKVRETLTRIGIASKTENKLWQSCHILHKRGKFYIVHFKELFLLDGKTADFSEEDLGRRNTIASLLAEWGLVKIINSDVCQFPKAPLANIKIITFKDKENWVLESKYTIGKK